MRLMLAVPLVMFASLALAQTDTSTIDHLHPYALPPSTAFDGKWAGDWTHGPTPEETDHLVLNLTSDQDGHLTGAVNVDGTVDDQIVWGFVEQDQSVAFEIMFPSEHGPIPLVFLGRRNGATINFGIYFNTADAASAPLKAMAAAPVLKFDAAKQ